MTSNLWSTLASWSTTSRPATALFVELGLKLQGEWLVEGRWMDRVVGLEGARTELPMVETPDGHGRLELTTFHTRSGRSGDRHAPATRPTTAARLGTTAPEVSR